MVESILDQKTVISYLKAQNHLNPSVAFDTKKCVLSDASAFSRRSALVAECSRDARFATQLAPYVGPGAISTLTVDALDDNASDADLDSRKPGLWLSDAETVPRITATVAGKSEDENPEQQLEMDDIVWRENSAPESHPGFGAGVVLLLKICGALTATYDPTTIAHVGNLVRNNTMTAVHGGPSSPGNSIDVKQDTEAKVSQLLSALLARTEERTRSVHVNSNEPVLLINNAGKLSEVVFGTIVTETIVQLHRHWNIWPVRIYAGRFLESNDSSFSISLLNVTNTDIGGPSMIQLLDAPCEARGWLGYVRREVWNGRDLLEKDERQQEELILTNSSEEDTPTEAEDNDIQAEAEQNPIPMEKGSELEEPAPMAEEVAAMAPESGLSDESIEPAPSGGHEEDQQPHEDVRKYFRPDAAPIVYPTWSHPSESESLLDLIKSQSSAVPEAQREPELESATLAEPKSVPHSGSGSDDEFVVV